MKCGVREVFKRLTKTGKKEDFIAWLVCDTYQDFFSTLIATVLSQNTSDKAALKAFNNLVSRLGNLTPFALLRVPVDGLKELIRPSGLLNSKANTIIESARLFKDGTDWFISMSCEDKRRTLIEIKGIGEKTADVVLLTCFGCRVFPSDTHIKRIFSRLSGRKTTYDAISRTVLDSDLSADELLMFHRKLITLGRTVCSSRNPKCSLCPLTDCCEYYASGSQGVDASRGRRSQAD